MSNKYANFSTQIAIGSINPNFNAYFIASAITISIHSVSVHHHHHGQHSL